MVPFCARMEQRRGKRDGQRELSTGEFLPRSSITAFLSFVMDDVLAQALRLLPHGAEFRFVERLLTLEPGREGTAEYRVRGDEPFLRGHFPGQPMFPGVLLVEAAAQLAGIVAQSDPGLKPMPGLKLT